MDPNADTEWNDALRAAGVLPPKEPDVEEVLDDALVDSMKMAHDHRLDKKTLDELDELEDEEDDEFLQMYRQKRMQEWQQTARAAKFGRVYPISKPDYTKEVTEASKEVFVVVHMFQDYIPACKLLNAILDKLAATYPKVKFVKIPGQHAVENYPDAMMPTLLVYGHGDLQRQLLTLMTVGGMSAKPIDIARFLVSTGALEESDLKLLQNEKQDGDSESSEDDPESDFD
ncbi:phosducin family protein [Schizosaccharomyces japonicus yFS275]|uniref:Phosducin family protein n=1 Tax=Schizosaccharomyces japonicus (strain yFS275 / FY16936) TaxID=402676 RepID=B6JVZ3_SCHJY|nr:phosducin family protein [Schizosaccharomyces japonicus yFS275]EEB05544.1 phosducin family protein [Schizosaccharomyces japonicus yFS275]